MTLVFYMISVKQLQEVSGIFHEIFNYARPLKPIFIAMYFIPFSYDIPLEGVYYSFLICKYLLLRVFNARVNALFVTEIKINILK